MPKYLVQASYTVEGLRGLQNDSGSGRRDAIVKAFQSMGGNVENVYFSFGDYDVQIVADMPDNVAATALGIMTSATGLIRTRITPLLTPAEVDEALKKTMSFRAPGR